MVGQHVGKYRVIERIGRGGMGTVYRATDETLHRDVAIKVLNSDLNDPEVARRFRAEAVTVARLNHPGIARIYELFEHQGEWLMVMEFVQGETLEQLVDRAGSLESRQAADVCMQVLAALAHAHGLGVVHRDLKPANIMITDAGTAVIMDFGIARVAGTEHLTSAGFMMGTPAYMAPEQVLGDDVDARADLYALGVVFYRLVTKALPFKGDTPIALAHAQVNNPPTPAATLRRDLPPWVDDILSRALAKRPADRYQSALEFRDALAWATGTARAVALTPPQGSRTRAVDTAGTDLTVMATPTPIYGNATASVPAGTGRSTLPLFDAGAEATTLAEPSSQARRSPLLLAAAVVVGVVAAGAFAMRFLSAPPAPAALANLTPDAAAPTSTMAAAPPPAEAPASAAAPTVVPPPPPATNAPVAGPPPVAAAAAPMTRGTTSVPSPRATAPPTAPTRPGVASGDTLLAVSDVRVLVVDGRKSKDEEALLQFSGGQLSIVGRRSGTTMVTVPYVDLLGATYIKARDPRWNPGFFSPPRDLDVGGVLRTSKHWLTLQGASSYVILRLEDTNVHRVLEAVESRLALRILRPTPDEREAQ